jgi:hypothetical protein
MVKIYIEAFSSLIFLHFSCFGRLLFSLSLCGLTELPLSFRFKIISNGVDLRILLTTMVRKLDYND